MVVRKSIAVSIASTLLLAGSAWAADGYLKVNANPGRTGVFVDGKYLGPAKNFKKTQKYKVAEGEHELRLTEPRYEDVVKKVQITANKTTKVDETMKAVPLAQPPYGRLRLVGGGKFDAVYLNDKFYGHKDEFDNVAQRVLMPPGEYTLRVEPVGGQKFEQKVTITANQDTIVKLK